MMDGLTPAEPTLDSLEEIVSCAERRVKRAAERMDRARDERAAWIKTNPELLL